MPQNRAQFRVWRYWAWVIGRKNRRWHLGWVRQRSEKWTAPDLPDAVTRPQYQCDRMRPSATTAHAAGV